MGAWRLGHDGHDISGDEQTIGFQGCHVDKLRITYKAEGDGFQCDAICDAGYTWTFFFQNIPAPQKWIHLGYSPLHSWILAMFDQLEDKNHNCWFDNDRIPSTTSGAEPPRDARDSGSARSHSTHLETSSSDRP